MSNLIYKKPQVITGNSAADEQETVTGSDANEITDNNILINFTDDLIWSVSRDFKLITANKAFIKELQDLAGITIKPGDDLLQKAIFPQKSVSFWEACYKKGLAGQILKKEIYTPAFNKEHESWTETTFNPICKADTVIGIACFSKNITAHKLAEEKLRQSEAHLAKAQKLAKLGSWSFDIHADRLTWSDELYHVFGADKQTFIETHGSFTDLVDDEDREFVLQTSKRAQETGEPYNIEYRITTPGGEKRIIQELGYGEMNNNGNVIFLFGTAQDITESKNSEAAVIRSYEEKNTILDRIDDGFFAIDKDSIVTYWNKRAEILLGVKREDIIGNKLHEIFAAPGPNAFYDNYQKAIKENITIHFEEFSKRTNKWFAVSTFASDNGLSVYFKDVTEQKTADVKLKESEFRYRSLIENATDTICIFDASLKFTEVNPSGCSMFGYSRKELLQLYLPDVLFEEDLKTNPLKIETLKSGMPVRNERKIKCKNGFALDVELSGKMLEDGKFVVFARDITERKQAKLKLTATSDGLQQALNELTKIMDSSLDVICTINEAGIFVKVSAASQSIWGYTPHELMGTAYINLLFKDDVEDSLKFEADMKSGLSFTMFENRYVQKDGRIIPMLWSIKWDKKDKLFYCIGKDATEKKRLEKAFEIERQRFYDLYLQAPFCMGILKGPNHIFEMANPLYLELIGQKDIIGKSVKEVLPELEDQEFLNLLDTVYKTGTTFLANEMHIKLKPLANKEPVDKYLNFVYHAHRDNEGNIDGILFFAVEVTEQVISRKKIEESNERYNLISKATNDMVWDWDLLTGKVYRNKEGWKKIFRVKEKEIENILLEDWDNKIHPEDRDKVKIIDDAILSAVTDFFEIECRVRRNDGTYAYILDRGNIIRNGQGKAVRLIGATQDITQRKEAELQVSKSESRYRSLVQNSSDLISILDEQTNYLYCSPATKRILGYEPEYMIGKTALSFIHPDDISLLMAYIEKIKSGKYIEVTPFRFRNASGDWRWLESKITDMRDNSEVKGYVVNSRDVTERIIAEEEIKKLSIIAKETVNAVIITDAAGKIIWVNEAFTHITEFNAEEVLGKKPGEFLQGTDTNLAVVQFMSKKLKNIEPFECDILNYSKSGRKYWLRIQCQPQFDETGKLKYFFAIETDITREKEAKEILRTSEERYRYLFNNNPASIIIWDIETLQILEINETSVAMYGYSREEFLSKTVLDLRLPEYYDKIKEFAGRARQKNNFISVNNWKHINKPGKEMCMQISSHRIHFKGVPVILSLATNITDKVILEKALEQERLERQQEITEAVISAQEQERQEIGGELHDNINQILAGSLLYLSLAKKELEIDHPYLKETDTLISSAINEIRNLSHTLITPSLHESEFLDALENIIEATQKTSGIMISLQTFGFDDSHIPDKLKLNIYRIVQEQINNILKHAGAQKVIVQITQDSEKTLLSIKDDGAGFDTTKKVNGVGLINIKTRASLYNGDVTIISSPGRGCELRVLFN